MKQIKENSIKIRIMKIMLFFSIMIAVLKFVAYFLTHSNAILTDALESIINVVAGAFALYSIYFSAQPKDENHPYGHGKIEYLSVGLEGGLIIIAAISIVIKGIYSFIYPIKIHSLDLGIIITTASGICNYFMGSYLVKKGKIYDSVVMIADGKHLLSDTITSIGIIVGLIIVYFTNWVWFDSSIAVLFGFYLLYTGYKLFKQSITSLLDEADYDKLNLFVSMINESRRERWIDMHNVRVLKYGSHLHIDAHITLPWYDTLEQTHAEVNLVERLITDKMGSEVEFFIHADPCLPISCSICSVADCKVRQHPFVKKLDWTLENLLPNKKHTIE